MGQSLAQLYVHLTFSTKDRHHFRQSATINEGLRAYMGGILRELESPCLAVGAPHDHVHILFCLARTRTLSDVVAKLKAPSTAWLKTQGSEYALFAWQSGYGAFSVSASGISDVTAYIANQEEHHRLISFQDEFRALLKRYHLDCDERYVWD